MPIIIICFSLIISCFRKDYIFIGSIFLLIAYLLFIKKEVTWILFILYIVFLLSTIFYTKLTTGTIYPELNIKSNIIPFTSIIETITLLLTKSQGLYYVFNYLILDIILFIPLGLFLSILFPKTKKIKKLIVICLTISIIKELLQLLLNVGMFNIDDIILNLAGAIISYIIFKKLLSKYMV